MSCHFAFIICNTMQVDELQTSAKKLKDKCTGAVAAQRRSTACTRHAALRPVDVARAVRSRAILSRHTAADGYVVRLPDWSRCPAAVQQPSKPHNSSVRRRNNKQDNQPQLQTHRFTVMPFPATAGLLTGAKKYRDALAAMTEAQQSFAGALHEFSGSDQDSLLLGRPWSSKTADCSTVEQLHAGQLADSYCMTLQRMQVVYAGRLPPAVCLQQAAVTAATT